jgi:MOSC domain-containing protein YiiM
MRNERQLSLLCPWELKRIARGMDINHLSPHWIGGNLVVSGFADFSMLPSGTLLFIEGGVTLKVDGQNAPCRSAGKAIQQRFADRDGLDLMFPKVAKRLRGLVAWVEKPGTIEEGAEITARLPEQWIYRG